MEKMGKMNNIQKCLLGGSIFFFLTAGTGVFYHFVYYLPIQARHRAKLEQEEQEHKMQLECMKLGEQIDKKMKESIEGLKIIPIDPEYYYNPNLKKCLYYGGDIDSHYIVDAYTNKDIDSTLATLHSISTMKSNDRKNGVPTDSETERSMWDEMIRFEKHKAELMP